MLESIICYNGTKVDGIESLCIFLERFAYSCRYSDMISRFERTMPELFLVSNHVMNFVYDRPGHLLKATSQHWLAPVNLQLFANKIHATGLPLDNCWTFIDGTVRPINTRILYKDHKKVIAIKFQSVFAPNDLTYMAQ